MYQSAHSCNTFAAKCAWTAVLPQKHCSYHGFTIAVRGYSIQDYSTSQEL